MHVETFFVFDQFNAHHDNCLKHANITKFAEFNRSAFLFQRLCKKWISVLVSLVDLISMRPYKIYLRRNSDKIEYLSILFQLSGRQETPVQETKLLIEIGVATYFVMSLGLIFCNRLIERHETMFVHGLNQASTLLYLLEYAKWNHNLLHYSQQSVQLLQKKWITFLTIRSWQLRWKQRLICIRAK